MTTKSCLLPVPKWLGVGVLIDLALVGIVEICYPFFKSDRPPVENTYSFFMMVVN